MFLLGIPLSCFASFRILLILVELRLRSWILSLFGRGGNYAETSSRFGFRSAENRSPSFGHSNIENGVR